MCANGIFLLFAVGFCILGIFESPRPRAASAGFAAVWVTVAASVFGYSQMYYPRQAHNQTGLDGVARMISGGCDPDAVVVYIGMDWDPTLPYYTQRRALMIPDWPQLKEEDVRKAIQ